MKKMHTPEPWAIFDGDPRAIVTVANPMLSLLSVGDDGLAIMYEEADARRIVACVNACAELDTDDLERFGLSLITKLREDEANVFIKQRDELLAAMEKIAKHYEDKCGLDATPSKRAEAWRLDYHNVKGIAINAIASVKGGAA